MRSLKQVLAVFLLAVLLAGMTPAAVFGAVSRSDIKFTISSIIFVMQGSESYVDVEVDAPTDRSYKLTIESDNKMVTASTPMSGTYTGKVTHTFTITANKKAETGWYTLTIKAVDPADPNNVLLKRDVSLSVTDTHNSQSFISEPAMEVAYAIQGKEALVAGEQNVLKLSIYNRGNVNMFNSNVSLKLPTGISIANGAASRNVGSFGIGKTINVEFPLTVESDVVTGSYPIEIHFNGTVREKDYSSTRPINPDDPNSQQVVAGSISDRSYPLNETVYVQVIGKDKQIKDESEPLLIVDSFDYGNGNGVLKRGADFTLKMTFLNAGSKDIHNAVINVLDSTGAVVPTDSSFIKIDSIKTGEKVTQSIGLRTVDGMDATQATLNVDMKYFDPDNKQSSNTYPIIVSIEKKPDESKPGGVANPILMVTNYSFGSDKAVMANSQFPLSLTITNTSAKTLRNIKVTVQDSTGSILPAEGSNSFFINSIGAGGSYGKLMPMAVSNDIKAGVSTIAVNMSYEDMDAHTFTSSDTITVPVTLQDRLVIDDILDPGNLMAGEMGYAQIKYYNMGQTTLNNLRIAVSGDFTIDGDSSQYVGNMANGRSDYFSFNFMPNSEGTMNGKAVFTYENAQGEEQVIEKEFTFNIQPAPEFNPEDMDFPVEEEKHGFAALPIWGKGLVALGALLAVILVIKGIKKHKKAKAEALTLDE